MIPSGLELLFSLIRLMFMIVIAIVIRIFSFFHKKEVMKRKSYPNCLESILLRYLTKARA